ncbi:MAG: Ig-like domain-containing protein [Micrococcales bacterium]|nr:Ig-like domain-containing protein [Micrococcales bacterium]
MPLAKVTMKAKTTMKAKALAYPLGGPSMKLTWTSSKPKVAKVSASGAIRALKAGSTVITAKAGGKKAQLKVTVVAKAVKVKGLKVAKAPKKGLKVGATVRLTVAPTPARGTLKAMPTFTSSKRSVATVDATGLITARAKGSTVIKVKLAGKSKKVVVKVI